MIGAQVIGSGRDRKRADGGAREERMSTKIDNTGRGLQLSRRDFNRTLLAAGSALAVGAAPVARATEPTRGGRLRVAAHVQGAQDTLDPAKFV